MGLALDESENTAFEILSKNEIDVLLDQEVKLYVDSGMPITVDYQETPYGAGFFISNGSNC